MRAIWKRKHNAAYTPMTKETLYIAPCVLTSVGDELDAVGRALNRDRRSALGTGITPKDVSDEAYRYRLLKHMSEIVRDEFQRMSDHSLNTLDMLALLLGERLYGQQNQSADDMPLTLYQFARSLEHIIHRAIRDSLYKANL